jgi:ABC-type Fe3+ transport system permease subunit
MSAVSGFIVGLVGGLVTRPGGAALVSFETLFAALEAPSRETWPIVHDTVMHVSIVAVACTLVALALAYVIGIRRTEVGRTPGS